MRKWIWSATALTMFAAVAMYLAAQHAAEHPDSLLARCFRTAGQVGMRCNPLVAFTLPEPPLRRLDKPTNQPICLMPDPMDMMQNHPEMCLPALADTPEVCEPIVVEGEPPAPASVDEDDTDPPAGATYADDDGYPASSAVEVAEEETVPMMPYIEEDDACDSAAAECECCEQEHAPCGRLRTMECANDKNGCMENCPRSLGQAIADYLRCLAGDEEACEEFETIPEEPVEAPDEPMDEDVLEDDDSADEETSDLPPMDEEPMNPTEDQTEGRAPDQHPARQDSHYHHHYPSCPYTGGCPYPYHYNVPRVDPPAATAPAAEEQEPPAELVKPVTPVKKKKVMWFMGEFMSINQPAVDTMECRPTDIHGDVESPF